MAKNFDLLGDPIPDNWGKRGRPEHVATQENRLKIRLLLAFGWVDAQIAKALRITRPTLRKHYFSELKHRDEARPALKAARLSALYKAAIVGGNVGALKELGREIEKDELARVLPGSQQEQADDRSESLGKKEAANEAAKTAASGTGWTDLLDGDGPSVH